MIKREMTLVNELGLHARASAKLVKTATSFSSDISIEHEGERVDAKSILGLLLLAAEVGTTLTMRCEGDDEDEAADSIASLVADRFGEAK